MKVLTSSLVALFVALGCGGSAAAPSGGTPAVPTPGNTPTAVPPTQSPRPSPSSGARVSGRFDIGGGRRMHIDCRGSGSPTIILEAGGGSAASDAWPEALLDALAERTRTCAYDRAGTGSSHQAPGPRLAKDITADLDALLDVAEVEGPYLLVGTSFGGLISLHYALSHPERTAGLVILDTGFPSADPDRDATRSVLTKAQWAQIIADDTWDSPGNVEHVDMQGVTPEVAALIRPLPGLPIRILTATRVDVSDCPPDWDCAEIVRREAEFQKDWLSLSPTAVRILVDSGHVMAHEAPDVVAAEILKALDDSRNPS